MIKSMLIKLLLKGIIGAIALGCGIWYLSSSLGDASLSYTSVDAFMTQSVLKMVILQVPMVVSCADISKICLPYLGAQQKCFGTQ